MENKGKGVENQNVNFKKGESCKFTNEELHIVKLFRKVKDPALKESVKSILSFAATASKDKNKALLLNR